MRHSALLIWLGFISLLFWGCPVTPPQNSDYLRSPLTFRVDTVPAAHPFCSQWATQSPFPSQDSCQRTKKYVLHWERPQDTSGLLEYRIYLDTSNSGGKTWSQIRGDRTLAQAIIPGAGGPADSLVFFFNNVPAGSPPEIQRTQPRMIALDTLGHIEASGRLVFAIVAAYRDAGQNGPPQYTWIYTTDRFPPFPLQPALTPYDRSIQIDWSRPPDPTSFFDPGADSGLIREYVLRVSRGGVLAVQGGAFAPQLRYLNGGQDWTARVRVDSFTTATGVKVRKFFLPDSQHVFDYLGSDPRDSLQALLTGLTPQDTVDVRLWAVDASGNVTDSAQVTRVILTDTTEPVKPALRLLSVARNQFV